MKNLNNKQFKLRMTSTMLLLMAAIQSPAYAQSTSAICDELYERQELLNQSRATLSGLESSIAVAEEKLDRSERAQRNSMGVKMYGYGLGGLFTLFLFKGRNAKQYVAGGLGVLSIIAANLYGRRVDARYEKDAATVADYKKKIAEITTHINLESQTIDRMLVANHCR